MNYAVIMAGGTGKRLWPLSRQSRPKQVLKLIDGQTLLRKCFDRLTTIFEPTNILVLTNAGYADIVRENLSDIPPDNVIPEPAVRDTAGAIGLAAAVLTKCDADAAMAVVTADQLIEPADAFRDAIALALDFVNQNPEALLTFGIQPTFPSTQYGYIKLGEKAPADNTGKVFTVDAFREKPDEAAARQYIEAGQYCWNSGMFVWKAKTILEKLSQLLPDSTEPLRKIHVAWGSPFQNDILKEWFLKMPKVSIDYAVMEKVKPVYTIRLDCRWLDMGSFAAFADIISADADGNFIVAGHSLLLDSKNNVIITEDTDHLIAAIGINEMVIAHSPDATLVCRLDDTERIKELIEHIKNRCGDKFL